MECKACKSQFNKKETGTTKYCGPCSALGTTAWRRANPDRNRETERRYKERNKEKLAFNAWKHQIKKLYGMTPEDYDTMLRLQIYKCAICGVSPEHKNNSGKSKLSVDHDHTTGRVRALLCHNCNIGLGHFFDNEGIIERVLTYVRYHKCSNLT